MSEAVAIDVGPGTQPELRLAECWAEFTKALSIYPETNARVRGALGAMQDALDAALVRARQAPGADPERGIAVLFREGRVFVGAHEFPFAPGTPFEWLRARLERAGLAGVEFLEGAGRDGMVAFSRRLLDNFLRKGHAAEVEDLWPDVYPGLALVDRRFDGTFGGAGVGGMFTGGHGGTGVAAGGDGDRFIKALLTHPRIAKRLTVLHAAGHAQAVDGEEMGSASAMLRGILQELPAEALRSRDTLMQSLCRVMDALARRADARLGDEDAQRARTVDLLQRVSRQHFSRAGPDIERMATDRQVVVGPSGGRARDALFDDDVAALLAEVESLPAPHEIVLRDDGPTEGAEQLSTLLHFLTHLGRPETVSGLLPLLRGLLDGPEDVQVQLLRRHIDVEAGADPARRDVVVQLLLRAGKAQLLRACGGLDRDSLVERFPEAFGAYLETLDLGRKADAAELDGVCEALGSTRLLSEARELAPSIAQMPGDRAAGLFQRPSMARLALVRLVLAHHPEPHLEEAATYLRALDLPEPEAFVLFHVGDVHVLTVEYLCSLIDLHLGRITREHAAERVSEVLCRHIDAIGAHNPASKHRLESLRHLARYPSVRARRLIHDLRRAPVLGLFGAKEPTLVRRVARDVARALDRP